MAKKEISEGRRKDIIIEALEDAIEYWEKFDEGLPRILDEMEVAYKRAIQDRKQALKWVQKNL